MELTPKQLRLVEFIRDYSARHGYAPTQQEMARRFRLKSLGSVQDYLKALEAKGYLSKEWNGRRAIRLTGVTRSAVTIPLSGVVAAGAPIEAIEQQESLEVPSALLRGGEHFGLRVKGESMIDDGIRDGDVVIVRKQADATNGQTVVAMLDGDATVKKFYRQRNRIELHPANATMQPLVVEVGQGFQVLGVVVGLIRKY